MFISVHLDNIYRDQAIYFTLLSDYDQLMLSGDLRQHGVDKKKCIRIAARNLDGRNSSQFGPQRLQVFVERFMDLGKTDSIEGLLSSNN